MNIVSARGESLPVYRNLVSTFSLERKGGAKSSRQIQLLRWICRANAQFPELLAQLHPHPPEISGCCSLHLCNLPRTTGLSFVNTAGAAFFAGSLLFETLLGNAKNEALEFPKDNLETSKQGSRMIHFANPVGMVGTTKAIHTALLDIRYKVFDKVQLVIADFG